MWRTWGLGGRSSPVRFLIHDLDSGGSLKPGWRQRDSGFWTPTGRGMRGRGRVHDAEAEMPATLPGPMIRTCAIDHCYAELVTELRNPVRVAKQTPTRSNSAWRSEPLLLPRHSHSSSPQSDARLTGVPAPYAGNDARPSSGCRPPRRWTARAGACSGPLSGAAGTAPSSHRATHP